MLDDLRTTSRCSAVVEDLFPLLKEMYPICRSITGDGVRRTLDLVERIVPLQRHEVPTGTVAFDWEVPREWNVRDAYIVAPNGRRVVDFRAHALHLVSYSVPVRRKMPLDELQSHLHSLPDQPDWIPYRTSYYKEDWGFCLRQRDRDQLAPGTYEVVVDTDLRPGALSYGECTIDGQTDEQAIVYTHTCHPSLANDNLTGVVLAAALARALRSARPRLTWRVVFGPGTIGSLVWLARNESILPRVRTGLAIGLLGDPGALTYKRSRLGNTSTDRAAEMALRPFDAQFTDFEPYGYDERQFCSPGFDLPLGRVTRSSNGKYPEYHSSADDLSFIRSESLAQSLHAIAELVCVLDSNRTLLNLNPKGEPRLGKRGLYGSLGGTAPGEFEHALLWLLNLSDGDHDMVAIAQRSGIAWPVLAEAADRLESTGLVRPMGMDQKGNPDNESRALLRRARH